MKIRALIVVLIMVLSATLYFGNTLSGPSEKVTRSSFDASAPMIQEKKQEEVPQVNPDNDVFVEVSQYIPSAVIYLKYATADNFTGEVIYGFDTCYLRYGTVKKLQNVQKELDQYGYRMKIWDGYRPREAQQKLWDVYPDSKFVANPAKGYTNHMLGHTVDMTLADEDGNELEMPTPFDEFSARADRDYSDVSKEAAKNAKLLEEIMTKNGFKGYQREWWHYTDTVSYQPKPEFVPK